MKNRNEPAGGAGTFVIRAPDLPDRSVPSSVTPPDPDARGEPRGETADMPRPSPRDMRQEENEMKTAAFAIAMLLGGAAFAQVDVTTETQAYEGDGTLTTAFETEGANGGGVNAAPAGASADATAAIVRPSNARPERDARGIPVISAAALVPAGWNGSGAGAAMGGPELDPATGESVAARGYPACTATVTDKCLQTYEVGRR